MPMQVLLSGPEEQARVREITAYAEAQGHWYKPGVSPIPGDTPEHSTILGTYRCVFSITVGNDALYRHLSISVPQKGRLPLPFVVFEIATMFGLTGWTQDMEDKSPEGWMLHVSQEENCVVIAQKWAPPGLD